MSCVKCLVSMLMYYVMCLQLPLIAGRQIGAFSAVFVDLKIGQIKSTSLW